jgi:hypothetical protein
MAKVKPKAVQKAEIRKEKKGWDDGMRQKAFIAFLIILVFALYGNTARNYYNLDDYHVTEDNQTFKKGMGGIADAFTTAYADETVGKYGYRPITRAFFALEYSVFSAIGVERYHPYISHVINVILYLIGILFLYKVLRRLFRDYHYLLPFLVTVLFAAHPIHTEIVASLKNRDELFVLIFCVWLLHNFLRYADTGRLSYLLWNIPLVILAFLSKGTTTAFVMFFFFSMFFFTNVKKENLWIIIGAFTVLAVIAAIGPYLGMGLERKIYPVENPISEVTSLWTRIAYGAYTLYYYLRLLIFPHPLRYYYGYDTIPLVDFTNIWVILSILFHLGIFVWAIYKFKEKHILSFAILAYLGSIAMFTNIVYPAPGIIAERFMLFPSLAFAIAVAYFLMKIFARDIRSPRIPVQNLVFAGLLTLVILIPYTYKTITRNQDWQSQYVLFKTDMKFLENSVKANDLYANEIMKVVNRELNKPVNVLKFVEPMIKEASAHWQKSVEIMPEYHSSWNNLGIIQSRIYKNYDSAIYLFRNADRYNPDDAQTLFNLGQAYEGKQMYDSAMRCYEKSLSLDSTAISTRSRMANLYYSMGDFRKAVEMNQEISRIAPEESLPFVNIGNYYFFQRDTLNALKYYERAVEIGAPAIVSNFLTRYYSTKGDATKAAYYQKKSEEREKSDNYNTP